MAVLDDASLTGIGRSSADVLGVPDTVVAQELTGHLLREIVARGSRGGPLASQLNDDMTHHVTTHGRALRACGPELDDMNAVTAVGRPSW